MFTAKSGVYGIVFFILSKICIIMSTSCCRKDFKLGVKQVFSLDCATVVRIVFDEIQASTRTSESVQIYVLIMIDMFCSMFYY